MDDALDGALANLDRAWRKAPNPFREFDKSLMEATCDAIRAWRMRKEAERVKAQK